MQHRYFTFLIGLMLCFTLGVNAQITVSADEPDAYYQVGESMNFEVSANYNTNVSYDIYFADNLTPLASGTVFISAGQTSNIPFTLNEAGIVFCEITQGGNSELAAAAFAPYEINQWEPEPSDFDAFWNTQKASLAAIPIDANVSFYANGTYTTTYKVDLAQINGRRVYGYVSIPDGAGPFPAILELPAFGSAANSITPGDFLAERGGAISVKIGIHNAPLNQEDPNAYEPNEITNEDNIYMRYAILAGIRAIDYVYTRSDFDGSNMGVTGVSQGGALAMMLAGIDDRINLLAYAHPAWCEHAGLHYDRASGFPFYVQNSRNNNGSQSHELATVAATRYYDVINFVKRYDGPSLGFVGYEDVVSYPAGIFAAFNELNGDAILMHEISIGHNPMPAEYWNGRYEFFRRHFPAMQNPPFPFPDETTGYYIDAGADGQTSGSSYSLSGSVYYNDQSNTSWPVQWELVEGPGAVTFANANAAATLASFSSNGTYILRFTAQDYGLLSTDDKYYHLKDLVTIEVGGGGNNSTLNLSCPADIDILLPSGTSSTAVSWNVPNPFGNCPSGGINLTQLSGPSNGSILPEGIYNVTYQATDNCNNVESCSFQIDITEEIASGGNYCETGGTSPWFEWISQVNLATMSHSSEKEGYADFTNISTEVNTGQSYPISVATNYSWQSDDAYVRIWIDYNQDQVFQEPGEIAYSDIAVSSSNGNTYTLLNGNVNIPTNANQGATRMRVSIQRDAYANPCGLFQYGEVEDYTIVINEGTAPTYDLTLNCPNDITVNQPSGNTGAFVNWTEPNSVTECPGNQVSLTQTGGPSPGTFFPEGNTIITYEATDNCGNMESCDFTVTVVVDDAPPPSGDYCNSEGITPWNEWISNVSMEQINNTTSKTQYSDYTNLEADVVQGGTYLLSISGAFSWQSDDAFLRVWADYNQDNIFQEPGEIIHSEIFYEGSGGATSALATAMISIPANALEGSTRMRVSMKRGAYAGPCEAFENGEVEDYSLNITEGNSPPPAVLTINCPADISLTIPAGQNNIVANWNPATANTNCINDTPIVQKTQGPTSGSALTEGSYIVTYKATDNCGNEEYCSFSIEVDAETTGSAGYCESMGELPWSDYIRYVGLNEIDNNSSKTMYSDFTDQVANLTQGESSELEISAGFSWQSNDAYLSVWIDYNQDGVFQVPGEEVRSAIFYSGNGGATSATDLSTITIPSFALLGTTRMRIALKQSAFADPCETFERGEVEDYSVNILEGTVNAQLTIDCSDDLVAVIPAGSSSTQVNWSIPTVSTTCPGGGYALTQMQGPSSGSFLQEGVYEVNYEATDNCNQEETCSFIITVNQDSGGGGASYCEASGTEPWEDYIRRVRFGSINNTSFKDGYGDFTDQMTNLEIGSQTNISLYARFSFQSYDEYFTVWIDWNHDGDFYDSGELVFSDVLDADFNGQNPPPVTGVVETPVYALQGATRMRVAMRRNAYAQPCGDFQYGEVEDYTVVVTINGEGLETENMGFLFLAAGKEQGRTKLDWSCNNADRTDLFEIERSVNGWSFEKISTQEVDSGMNATSHFQVYDELPFSGNNHYRIKQLFDDGTVRYSAIRKLEFPDKMPLLVYPNPASEGIYVQLKAFEGQQLSLGIYNALGEKMKEFEIRDCKAEPVFIDVSNFVNGIYTVLIRPQTGKQKSKWFVIGNPK